MPIDAIRVYVICDACGVPFSVGIDAAAIVPVDWDIFEMAIDAVRGSLEYQYESLSERGKRPGFGDASLSSVQDGKLLCCDCTVIEDRKHDDDT